MSEERAIVAAEAPPPDAPSWLVHQWTLAGVVSASATFVPVPFLDDWIQSKCQRFAVARTLDAHGASSAIDALAPYYGSPPGFWSSVGGMILKAPLKLALYPIRKPLKLVRSVRDVPLEIARTVLLARTLDRLLRRGEFPKGPDGSPAIGDAAATRLRKVFDKTFAWIDFRAIGATTKDAVGLTRRLRKATLAAVPARSQPREEILEELQSDPTIDAEAQRVQQALERPEILRLFDDFDARFDRIWEETRPAERPTSG